jgi:ribonucleoside-triphosphate reductase (thioredoxin)
VEDNLETPWSTVGYLTYARTYSRAMEDGKQEELVDTVERVIKACGTQLDVGFTEDEEERLRRYMMQLKGIVAGRFLWQLGTTTVDKLGLFSLQNCSGCLVDSPIRPFTWTFDALMLGSGVGYNIQREYVYKLPPVDEKFQRPIRLDESDADFIVPDSREGWVKLLEYTLRAAFDPDGKNTKRCFTYSTQLVRGKGAPIKGFGGVASGPEDLVRGIENISKVIELRKGKQLRPIDCLDIMNIIGSIVVSGNVRRSAQIAIGDSDDIQFLKAKNWSEGNIPNWRSMSNNSVVCNDINKLPDEFWRTYDGGSEPYGLINLKLSQNTGRLGETQYKDKKVRVFNPCAEQSLEPYESCCLGIVFLPNIKSKDELLDLLKLLYRVKKHSLALPCHSKETEEVVHRNMRMGLSMAGYLSATDEQREWLSDAYVQLRQYDVEYSAEHGWPVSIKLTTMKPDGTCALLPYGITPGVHPGFAEYMIRRIRVSSGHPLVQVCKDHGYPVEFQKDFDGGDDRSTVVVEFPFSYPKGTVLAEDLTAIDQLEWVKKVQTDWSDNSVSCTVYYRKEELQDIRDYLKKNYNKTFKTLSFLLHTGHGFVQAPFESISKEEYDKRVADSRIITSASSVEFEAGEDCAGGMCPIK